ncbi:DUF3761 domain-containing protein [Candidatus Saccharibacteria bacterium]|nr:DUF3761 domain-containing protein [Candidatus Saccharibacteria bacterium]
MSRQEIANTITVEPIDKIVTLGTKKHPVYTYSDPEPFYTPDFSTYQNTDGYTVPRPTYAPIPSTTPTAQCYDYSYSYSLNASGTCSGHGGVMLWY